VADSATLEHVAGRLPARLRRRFEPEEALADAPSPGLRADDAVMEQERRTTADRVSDALKRLMSQCDIQDRLILTMCFNDGRTVAETALTHALDARALYRRVRAPTPRFAPRARSRRDRRRVRPGNVGEPGRQYRTGEAGALRKRDDESVSNQRRPGVALDDRRHPDAEQLAEYADGVLGAGVRAEVEKHLVDCADCCAVLSETIAFIASEPADGRTHATSAGARVLPFHSRPWVKGAAAGLAAAAALVLVVRLARPDLLAPMFVARSDRPELQELIAAVANEPTRPVEGRLTGGFKYGPPPSPTRGPGDRNVSPDVRIAAAKIEKMARADDTPQHRAALGLAHLALGDLDKAVEALEDATQQQSGNAQFQSDLAAAYLARARWRDRAEDWARALAAADRAIKADPRRTEAYFNRALALEGLHLTDQALEVWAAYQSLEPATPWSRESATRIQSLRDRRQRSAVPGAAAADGTGSSVATAFCVFRGVTFFFLSTRRGAGRFLMALGMLQQRLLTQA
jgi:tetratricopeptide (TPR) repeat protein